MAGLHRLCGLIFAVAAASGCSARLSENFDGDAINAPPPAAPKPTPPDDLFFWSTIETTARVAATSGGGNLAVVSATPSYYQNRGLSGEFSGAMMALSASFSKNTRTVHGKATLSIVRGGRALFAIKIAQGVGNPPSPAPGNGGYVGAIELECSTVDNRQFASWIFFDRLQAALDNPDRRYGTSFGATTNCGDPMTFNWSIDQIDHVGSVDTFPRGRQPYDFSYDAMTGGVPNNPIERIFLQLLVAPQYFGGPPNTDFAVRIDNLLIEQSDK